MAVTVGTDVNSTVAETDTYHSARGNLAWAAQGTGDKEVNKRKAADWLERNFNWRGTRLTSDQRLGWPRDAAFDDDGYQIGESAAPLVVQEAEAIIADVYRGGTVDLEGIVTNDTAATKFQKVDVIEIEYDTGKRLQGQDIVSHVYKLLTHVTAQDKLLRA